MKIISNIILLLVLLIFAFGCKEKTNPDELTTISFEKVLFGHIDSNRFIIMNVKVIKNEIIGTFFDTTYTGGYKFFGMIKADSSFYIREFDSFGNQTGLFTGSFMINSEFSGIWMKPDSSQKAPFFLVPTELKLEELIERANDRSIKETKKRITEKQNINIDKDLELFTYYKADGKQGVIDVKVTLINHSAYLFDKVKVKVDYYKANGVQIKTHELQFVGLAKGKMETLTCPDDNKAKYVLVKIIEAEAVEARYYFNHYTQMFSKK